ncbi:primosomal replication protein N, partial [Neisseria gonorrhoeae]
MGFTNLVSLAALIEKAFPIRYTPAGIPVLDIILKHESWQEENGQQCLVQLEIPARILGRQAEEWQYRQGDCATVEGFLAQKSRRSLMPMLRI